MRFRRFFAAALATIGLGAAGGAAQAGQTFDVLRQRGTLNCGVNVGIAGFSLPDSQGVWRGMDADLCRGLAAAVLGDPAKVRFVPLTAVQRFTALQSGEIDVLIRNTTYTSSRDGGDGARFVATTFFDGQGMGTPDHFFRNPTEERTKLFLSQIL
jgi:general L-amino acid transport system substrate-binding protein